MRKKKIIEKFVLGGKMMAEAKKRVSIGLTDKQFELVEKISKLADKVLNKINIITPLPTAIRFITKVVTKGIDLTR